jgi:hypothetical protein
MFGLGDRWWISLIVAGLAEGSGLRLAAHSADMAVDPQKVESAKRLSRIVVPISIAAALSAFKFVPTDYRDLVGGFCGGIGVGMLLMLWILYSSQAKAQPPDGP